MASDHEKESPPDSGDERGGITWTVHTGPLPDGLTTTTTGGPRLEPVRWCGAWSPVPADVGAGFRISLPCELAPGHDGPHSWE